MKKLFTLVAMTLLAMGINAQTEPVTLDFTENIWGIPEDKVVDLMEFTSGDYTIMLQGTAGNGYKYYPQDHYVILGKKGAFLTFPYFPFDVEAIEVVGRSAASAAVIQNIFLGDEAVSTETTGAKETSTFRIAEDKQASGNRYELRVLSEHNTQITKIVVYPKGTYSGSDTPTPEVKEVNVAQALDIISALEEGKTTSEDYKVKGFVVGTPDFQRKDTGELYGNVNFNMADEKQGATTITVFRAKNFENAAFTEETILNTIKEGDEVVVIGKLQKYSKDGVITPELSSCHLVSVNGAASVSRITTDDSNAPIYNIAGQRVEKTVKGVYIQNGKKFVVK